MRAFKGYNERKVYTDAEKLPVGAYVVRLLKGAREEVYTWGSVLLVPFDIDEGDYKDFYTKQFQSSQMENKKYKGVFRMNLPKEDGTEQDEWTMRRFKTNMVAIEESNANYHWDWNEAGLAGKKVAMLFQNKEWEFNNQTGWSAQPYSLISIEKFREGKYKLPADKPLANKKGGIDINPADDFSVVKSDDGDLPF
ncbi:MAG: hypothetical protein IJD80_00005 [Oscillospiraceae bacterium]|nr:hypothetical protein [Oscillospiraceae bacterium]